MLHLVPEVAIVIKVRIAALLRFEFIESPYALPFLAFGFVEFGELTGDTYVLLGTS